MDTRRAGAARDLVENEKLVRISRSLHTAWRNAVRTPWRNFRRRLRGALHHPAREFRSLSTRRPIVKAAPFEGRLPPPLTQCEVVAPVQYRTRMHPLSVNSRDHAERLHYVDHTVHAPAMMLEHLADQYWFPAFGVLISPEGRIWRHSFLGAVSGRVPVVDQGDRRLPAAGRDPRASAASRTAQARASHRGRASAHRRFGQAQLWPLSARHRSADRSRRENARSDADLDFAAMAAGSDRAARRP